MRFKSIYVYSHALFFITYYLGQRLPIKEMGSLPQERNIPRLALVPAAALTSPPLRGPPPLKGRLRGRQKRLPFRGAGSRHRRLTERSPRRSGVPPSPSLRSRCAHRLWQSVIPVQTPVSRPKVGDPMGAEPPWSSGRESRGDCLEIGPLWRFLFPVSFPLKETGSRRSAKSPRPVPVPAAAGNPPPLYVFAVRLCGSQFCPVASGGPLSLFRTKKEAKEMRQREPRRRTGE